MRLDLKPRDLGCPFNVFIQRTRETEATGKKVLIIGEMAAQSMSVACLLCSETDPTTGGESIEASQALQTILGAQPDIVLMEMPTASRQWIGLIEQVKSANDQIKVLAVCGENDADGANRVLRAGADGCVSGQESADEIMDAIDDVAAGALYVGENLLADSSKSRRASAAKSRAVRPESLAYEGISWNPLAWARAIVKLPVESV